MKDYFTTKDRVRHIFVIGLKPIIEDLAKSEAVTTEEAKDLKINSIRIDVTDELLNEVHKIINTHKSGQKMSGEKYTNGHIARSV